MQYHLLSYFAIFLPVVLVIYQLMPKKFRWVVLLAADYFFFWKISNTLIVYIIGATFFTHYIGIWLENVSLTHNGTSKEITAAKRRVLAMGVLISLGILIWLKYTNFFGETFIKITNLFNSGWKFTPLKLMVPVGISYYTLQSISYMTDVYRGTQKAEKNIAKMALYLSFFPTIMEGPITRFSQVADDLYEGKSLEFENIKFGYQRIAWGLFKKIVLADRLAPVVTKVFDGYANYDGSVVLFAALCYTYQLYMEFSGCIDIIIGSGQLFGIKLPENFRQPFFAKDASDFWRRWHITLGTFFKDYIFYPVSLAKPVKNMAKRFKNRFGRNVSKFVAPTIALFCVWSCNGLWHGANFTYIFYGMYYFVIIFLENILDEPVGKLTKKLHINREGRGYRVFKFVKLFIIVNTGELIFRANTLTDGFKMIGRIFTRFHISSLAGKMLNLGIDQYDLAILLAGLLIVIAVGIIKERNINIRQAIAGWKLPIRWAFWYGVILVIILFGAYGVGYTTVDMIYAGY